MFKLSLQFIGNVYKFTFPRRFAQDLTDTFKIYNCEMQPLRKLGEKSGTCSYFITILSKKILAQKTDEKVIASAEDTLKIHYKKKMPASALKFSFQGYKYQALFPVKHVKELARISKPFGCSVCEISKDEGDGMVNIYITIPEKKFVLVEGIFKLYIKCLNL